VSVPVIDRLSALFPTVLYVEAPAPDADLIDGGVLDSLALVELLTALEVEFSIEVPLDELDLERIRTLTALADLVSERVAHATPGAA
jgi:acyl carrier protein